MPNGVGLAGVGVVVAVLAGVQDGGDGLEGGFADLGADGDLLAGLVPQDGQVEGGEQLGLEPWRQAGQDVPGEGELVQEAGVGGGRCGLGQGLELGFERVRVRRAARRTGRGSGRGGLGGGVVRGRRAGRLVRGSWSPARSSIRLIRVLRAASCASRSAAAAASVAGSWAASRAARSGPKIRVGEERAGDAVQEEFGDLDGAGVVGVVGGVLGVGPVVRAPVVGELATAIVVGAAGHPALAVPAPDPGPVGVEPRRGRVGVQVVPVPAGAVPGGDASGPRPRWPGRRWPGAPVRVTTATGLAGRGCGGRCGCGAGRRPCTRCTWGCASMAATLLAVHPVRRPGSGRGSGPGRR